MTSPSGRRSDFSSHSIDDTDLAALRQRSQRIEQILHGALPTVDELLEGYPLRNDSLQADVMAAIDDWRQRRAEWSLLEQDAIDATERARACADEITLEILRVHALQTAGHCQDDARLAARADIWLAYLGQPDASARTIMHAATVRSTLLKDMQRLHRLAFAVGMTVGPDGGFYEAGDAHRVVDLGMRELRRVQPIIGDVADLHSSETGLKRLLAKQHLAQSEEEEERVLGELETLMIDAGSEKKSLEAWLEHDGDEDIIADGKGMVVVPKLPTGIGGQKEVRASWSILAGRPLPLVQRGDVAGHRDALVARYPHAGEIIDIVLRDLAPREEAVFRPHCSSARPGPARAPCCGQSRIRLACPLS